MTIDGSDYFIPATGEVQYLMLNDEAGTEVQISPYSVVIGSETFYVPNEPPLIPEVVTQGGYQVTFHARSLPSPILQPATSIPGLSYARQVAENYIEAANDTTDAVGHFFHAFMDFYARFDAPSPAEATELLGSEEDALDSVIDAAYRIANITHETHQEEWHGFIRQVSLLKPDPDDVTSEQMTPAQYLNAVYSGLPGIRNLCDTVPWRMEGLLNIAHFLARDDWVSRQRLVDFLTRHRAQYMDTQPTGLTGLQKSAGVLVAGFSGFSVVSRVQLPVYANLFEERSWFIKTTPQLPPWYFASLTDFLDRSKGLQWDTEYNSTGCSYSLHMNIAQGKPITGVLDRLNSLAAVVYLNPTWREMLKQGDGIDELRNSYSPEDRNATIKLSPEHYDRPKPLWDRDLIEQPVPPAYRHQRLVSAESSDKTPLKQQAYKRDDSGGSGIWVFIIDGGFDLMGEGVSHDQCMVKEKVNKLCRHPNLVW